jgi:hypothetical protein
MVRKNSRSLWSAGKSRGAKKFNGKRVNAGGSVLICVALDQLLTIIGAADPASAH